MSDSAKMLYSLVELLEVSKPPLSAHVEARGDIITIRVSQQPDEELVEQLSEEIKKAFGFGIAKYGYGLTGGHHGFDHFETKGILDVCIPYGWDSYLVARAFSLFLEQNGYTVTVEKGSGYPTPTATGQTSQTKA